MFKKLLTLIVAGFIFWKIFPSIQEKFPAINMSKNAEEKEISLSSIKPKSAPQCVEYMKYQKFDMAAACYKSALINDKLNPELSFFLAFSLCQNKDFSGCKFYADYTSRNFPKSEYAPYAQKLLEGVTKLDNKKTELQNNDIGDYYNELETPARWIRMPIKVWIQHTNNDANLANAFYTWQNALYPTVAFQMVNRKEDAQLQVVFGKLPQEASEYAVGVTHPYVYERNHSLIGKATIFLTQFDSQGGRLSDNDIYGVLVHEIGHALGLGGHSKNKNDVMFYSTEAYNLRPTRRDVNTVRKLYSSIKID